MNFLYCGNTAALSHNIVADIIMLKDPSWPMDLIFNILLQNMVSEKAINSCSHNFSIFVCTITKKKQKFDHA